MNKKIIATCILGALLLSGCNTKDTKNTNDSTPGNHSSMTSANNSVISDSEDIVVDNFSKTIISDEKIVFEDNDCLKIMRDYFGSFYKDGKTLTKNELTNILETLGGKCDKSESMDSSIYWDKTGTHGIEVQFKNDFLDTICYVDWIEKNQMLCAKYNSLGQYNLSLNEAYYGKPTYDTVALNGHSFEHELLHDNFVTLLTTGVYDDSGSAAKPRTRIPAGTKMPIFEELIKRIETNDSTDYYNITDTETLDIENNEARYVVKTKDGTRMYKYDFSDNTGEYLCGKISPRDFEYMVFEDCYITKPSIKETGVFGENFKQFKTSGLYKILKHACENKSLTVHINDPIITNDRGEITNATIDGFPDIEVINYSPLYNTITVTDKKYPKMRIIFKSLRFGDKKVEVNTTRSLVVQRIEYNDIFTGDDITANELDDQFTTQGYTNFAQDDQELLSIIDDVYMRPWLYL